MKTLTPINSLRVTQGKKFLGLMLISGVFGISLFGCNQETATTPSPTPATPKSTATTTTATPKPSPTNTTVQSTSATTIPKPSPTTATPQANQSPPTDLPKPNPKGNYTRTFHKFWQIVDPSGKGVSCRMGKATIEEIQTPGNSVVLDIGTWPIIGNFKDGQSFEINLGPAGFGILPDNQKEPWIFVEKTSVAGAPVKCFVRANSSFVKPISAK